MRSEKLSAHIRFLYSHGSMYKIFNQNLMFHGCIPMEADGAFMPVQLDGKAYKGRALMDACDRMAWRAVAILLRLAYGLGQAEDDRMIAIVYRYFPGLEHIHLELAIEAIKLTFIPGVV